MEDKRVPELRFKGFIDDWELCLVQDLSSSTLGGGTPKTSIKEYWNGNIPWIQSGDLQKDNMFKVEPTKFITDEAVKNSAAKIVPADSIAIVTRVGVGKLVLMRYSYATSQDFLSLVDLKNDLYFTVFLLNRLLKLEEEKTQGTSIKGITKNDLLSKKIFVPKLFDEQNQIGIFLKALEKTIDFHQRKLEQLELLKRAYLQQIFPENDKTVPKLRFTNFNEDWEQRKLGELAEFNPKSTLPDVFQYVDLESVDKSRLVSHRTEVREGAPSRAQRLAKKGDVFFQTVRPYQKNNFLFDLPYKNFVFSTGYAQMRPVCDSYFLLNRLQEERFVAQVLDRSTGTSYPAINSNDLAQIKIGVSIEIKEQIKIGALFKTLDTIFTLHQHKLNNVIKLKQTYLQKMFI